MTTHIKQFSRKVKSLILADKLVFIGSIVVILGLFFPWFSINLSDLFSEDTQSTIAFTGLTYIIGYLCYIFSIIALNTLDKSLTIVVSASAFILILLNISETGISIFAALFFLLLNIVTIFTINSFKLIKRIKKYVINLFVGFENIILIFVASMIYHKQSIDFTSANLSFGVYVSLSGAALIFYGGILQMKSNKKTANKEAFAPSGELLHRGVSLKPDLNIDKSQENKNNEQVKKENSQLSFGDYE